MKLREKPFFQVSVPILAQVLLFFINYVILYTTLIFQPQNRETAMVVATLIFTSFVMGFGYDKMGFWIIGWILYFIATSIASVYFIEIVRGDVMLGFSYPRPIAKAIFTFLIQIIIWFVIRDFRKAKQQKMG